METTHSRTSLNLEHALKVLRRRWWVVGLCFVLALAASVGLLRAQTKEYTATASLLFTNTSVAQQASGVVAASQSDPVGQRNTDLSLVQLDDAVPEGTAAQLNAGLTAQQVSNAVSASLPGQSNVVSVSATWTSPELAARIANAYAQVFIAHQRQSDQASVQSAIDLVDGQYTGLTRQERATPQGQSLLDHLESLKILEAMQNNTQLIHSATRPTSPSSPKVVPDIILAATLGLLLGVGLAFLMERFDRRLREASEIEESYGLPILGMIPRGATVQGAVGVGTVALEPFGMLRAHLRYFNIDRQLRLVLVASAMPGEGKTTIASNVAGTAARMGTNTLLIEADLRRPVLAEKLGLRPGVGLSEALVGVVTVEEAIQQAAVEGRPNSNAERALSVLPAGVAPPNAAELLESHAMERLLVWARENYELVIIDTAPLSVVADTIALVKGVDGVLVVGRVGYSMRDSTAHLRDRLESLGTPILGVVINDVRRRGPSGYGYAYDERGDSRQEPEFQPGASAAARGEPEPQGRRAGV